MFQRWKLILTNWINCYISKSTENEQQLNINSLVTIISHLRENLSLDESKSSILDAHTVEEFLCEKYPDFKFENGSVEASNDEELCLSASLLLYFVCVNSKNFDIKNAMCSKLGSEDQETILKFSKCLMECPVITVGEVRAAVTEACGQDIAAMELPRQPTIAETPPAMRSLHSTVRRLQAALDAEKFDRNYLQEELARTNNKLERLLKEKEQHKLEVLNLKAKISLCCGDEAVAKSAEAAADVSAKLSRQLQQLELRLEETQAQLDDVIYDRDTYKAKMDELKNERDNCLALSQQDIVKISQLSEELETERRHNQSLKDLVTELRQHNRLNMDCSVECDDPDASIHSLQHNSSICSEACANVVEVQLAEERAKIVVLHQQIQTLQVQISELNQIREADKTTLKNLVAQRDNDICNLKHRINEEIEKKNILKTHCDNEKTKLNNEINELEQKLKENHEYSSAVIEKKMEEIQTLQEEKLTLLHSLNNETTKLENTIKDLQRELDAEKQSRTKMRECYENRIMKLNEKVLNRNNELVELQNAIFEKGELIEKLQIELRNEKEAYGQLITQYQSLNEHAILMETEFKKEKDAFKDLVNRHQIINEEKNALQMEVEKEKQSLKELMTNLLNVNQEKHKIETELARAQEALKDLTNKYDNINKENDTMQTDLKKIKEAGKKLQAKYQTLHEHHKELKHELVREKEVFSEINNKYENLNRQNNALQIELVQIKEAFEEISQKYKDVIEEKDTIQNELDIAKNMINNKYENLNTQNNALQIELVQIKEAFKEISQKYEDVIEEKDTIQNELDIAKNMINNKYENLNRQNNALQIELVQIKEAFKEISQKYEDVIEEKDTIQNELDIAKNMVNEFGNKCLHLEKENDTIQAGLQKVNSAFERLTDEYKVIVGKNNAVQLELKNVGDAYKKLLDNYKKLEDENNTVKNELHLEKNAIEVLTHKYHESVKQNDEMQTELQRQKDTFEELLHEYRNLQEHRNTIENDLRLKCEEEQSLKLDLENKVRSLLMESETLADKLKSYECQIENSNIMVNKLSSYLKDKTLELDALRKDKDILQQALGDKCQDVKNLNDELMIEKQNIEKLTSDFDAERQVLQNMVSVTESVMEDTKISLHDEISQLCNLKTSLEVEKVELQTLLKDLEVKYRSVTDVNASLHSLLKIGKKSKEDVEKESESIRDHLDQVIKYFQDDRQSTATFIQSLESQNQALAKESEKKLELTALCQEKASEKYACHLEPRDTHQVDSSSSDTHSSVESIKTITDLEKIIHDKNRTITTLQTDITYLKSLMAESENKLLDVTKELENSKDYARQLSDQLKKIVHQKNEDIAELKKQVTKMSVTENRATQIIKVSAKYQAMILKRVAEIKSNTVLKELTNFGNSENEVRRSLAGSITMEDLENFLETTDRHLKRCSEKLIALQKERDRLIEVNRIHESEIINLKKFLTELSVSFQTFSSMKDLYGNKLSRVISVQRTVRREILNLDGRITDSTLCKLERGYGAAMQDLTECAMNLQRWVERCISRTVSVEKIKQAFTSDDRLSLSSPSFQNTGLEIQLEELEKLFQKLLEEIARAVKNEGATETQATTVMEVRAEYEDKLNRMKAKMKELFNEQMTILKSKQREDLGQLQRELQKTRSRMEESKRAYEAHIEKLTSELWNVGEKYVVKNNEAEWLKKKQKSGSLMSLQHVHSSGLVPHLEPVGRPSDAQSLRSLPVSDHLPKTKRGRGLHMSDEEGEIFDNRCLKELAMTPRREQPQQRLSELKWRNSLCPPHLKSSYPAETQFAPTLDEDDLKSVPPFQAGASAASGARGPRKEVGITAYKKPGPPTPSKQAGRLSATDSELRESMRVEGEPAAAERKTSTPARFRAFLRLNKHSDSTEGTPRARRLSSIFRKK